MNRFQYISADSDRFLKEVKMGFISTSVLSHFAIYSRYQYYRKMGHGVKVAVKYTGESMCCGDRYVYKVIKNMETDI